MLHLGNEAGSRCLVFIVFDVLGTRQGWEAYKTPQNRDSQAACCSFMNTKPELG